MDIFLRNIDKAAVKHIDEIAEQQGKSRQQFLKDYVENLAHFPAIIKREDRLEEVINRAENTMLKSSIVLEKMTDTLREIIGEDEIETRK